MDRWNEPDAIEAFLAARDGVTTVAEWRARGFSRADLRQVELRHGLQRVTPQVLLSPRHTSSLTPLRLAMARSDSAVASHVTAAVLWAADAFGMRERHSVEALRRPHVIVPPGGRAPGCTTHQSDDLWAHELASVRGIACTEPARTLCDLGSDATPAQVERALEWALRNDQVSEAHLWLTLGRLRRRGRKGPAVLGELLNRRGAGTPPTESDAETVTLQAIRRPGQPEPIRQRPVRGTDGSSFRVDFAFEGPWLPAPVWIEVDGYEAHVGREALVRDLHRQNTLMRVRPVLLRFTAAEAYRHPTYVRQETWRHLPLRS